MRYEITLNRVLHRTLAARPRAAGGLFAKRSQSANGRTTMRLALSVTIALVAFLLAPPILLAQTGNECTTVVLHAVPGFSTGCQTGFDCIDVQPTTRIDNPAGAYTVQVVLKNYNLMDGVQVAFDWPIWWGLGFGLWNCLPGQYTLRTPQESGSTNGTLITHFDPISGGGLAMMGILVFNWATSGCLSIIQSAFPGGNVVLLGTDQTPLLDINEGSVCSDAAGWNTCDCRNVTAIPEPGPPTWGQLKARYGR